MAKVLFDRKKLSDYTIAQLFGKFDVIRTSPSELVFSVSESEMAIALALGGKIEINE